MSAAVHIIDPATASWLQACEEIFARQNHVTIHREKISKLQGVMAQHPITFDYWTTYVSPVDRQNPNIKNLFFEMAMTVSQFGGFVYYAPDGKIKRWKQEGSGVKALIATIQDMREKKVLPYINLSNAAEFETRAIPILFQHSASFVNERVSMFKEFLTGDAYHDLTSLIDSARKADGSYVFTQEHVEQLAERFPVSYGGDSPFYKKASLLFMMMEIALNDLGIPSHSLTIPPSDYRLPQILEAHGVLAFGDDLSQKLNKCTPLPLNSQEARAIRAATVIAVTDIQKATGTRLSEVDARLYMMSRQPSVMAQAKPHMIVPTMNF
jgi:hypothetical protein